MEIFILSISAFIISILTFFSGFGLGTILSPIFMIFFPIEIAIGLTGIVHFFNNIFKLILVGRHTNKEVLIRFGVPAILFSILGSWLLIIITNIKPLFSYEIYGKTFHVYPVKLVIAVLLILFTLMEMIPYFKNLEFSKNKLFLGGVLSGFFGGLSGNQGALRSAFLIKAGLSKEEFISTAVVISTFVDFTRLSVYATKINSIDLERNILLIICSVCGAVIGAFLGNILLKKVTFKYIQKIVALMVILFSICLGLGFV